MTRAMPWVGWVGAVIIFLSWMFQNYFEAKRQDELDYLAQAQLLISIEEGHFSEWSTLLLIEQAKDAPNDHVLSSAALKAAQHQLNILTWATARVTDPATHADLLSQKTKLLEAITTAYEQGNENDLLAILNTLSETANSEGPSLLAAFAERYETARSSAELWRQAFLFTYFIGSLLVGASIVRHWRLERSHAERAAAPRRPPERNAKRRR